LVSLSLIMATMPNDEQLNRRYRPTR
jgi:hypothetical protein